jgi:hypothetical protein
VKKDCIKNRFTTAWFTPEILGVYKGQCAELCGANHGIMLVLVSVVTPADFDRYISLQRSKDDTFKVWSAIQPVPGTAIDEKALRDAIAAYLAKGNSAERQYALRFWIASHYATLQRVPPAKGTSIAQVFGAATTADIPAAIQLRREKIDAVLKELVAQQEAVSDPHIIVAGAQP